MIDQKIQEEKEMRILIAEDEVLIADAVSQVLKSNNYSVDAVHDGEEALDYLNLGNYDIAILDIMMPKMDGLTVLKKIREKGMSIPVLILTAKSEIDDRVTGLDMGADDYLTKPFSMKELLARVRAMGRRQPDLKGDVLSFGDIELNRAESTLKSDKGSVRLPSKEYQMMEMFLLRSGQVIPTEIFMENIWGYDSEAEINVVWVNISSLRKKLSDLGSGVRIKASRGSGYFLEEDKND